MNKPVLEVDDVSAEAFAHAYYQSTGRRSNRRRRRRTIALSHQCLQAARNLPTNCTPSGAMAHLRSEICGGGVTGWLAWMLARELIAAFVRWLFSNPAVYSEVTGRPLSSV